MTDVVTRLIVRADGSLATLDQFGKKMSDAGQAADMATGGVARFEAAQKRMQDAQQRGLAVTTESVARRTKEQRVFEQAASSIDRQFALRIRLQQQAEKSAVAMSNAVAAGYLREEQALELLMQQERQHAAQLSQQPGRGMVGVGGSFNTANIAAQFQDIGVTAAMGMNPLQIALQQGTQLSAVFATMEKPLEGIVTGLRAIISPLSLMTIGIIALVAAGLQFVDWGAAAEMTLNFLADGLEVIAPYAAAAAVGLALLYSPAIISGLVTVVGSLGTVAKAVWGVATAIYATVGLPALLIAGFVAIVAGAVIWRDELTKMLGVDIVGAAQDGINFIIGAFVGGFKGIQVLWATLPAVLGDITIQAAQSVLDGITTMLNESRTQVLGFLSWVSTLPLPGVNHLAAAGVGALAGAGELTAPQIPNRNAGAAAAVASYSEQAMSDAMATDYLGEAVTFVQGAASGAADALRGLADSMGVDEKASKAAAKEAERQAEAYRDLTRDARQFIAEQHLEAQALGMTEEAANRLRYEQDMLNKAANDNIKLSSEQRAEISGLAAEMVAAEESTRRLTEIYDLGKEVFSGFFADMKSGLREGQSFWEALGNAGANALDKIADRALTMAANGIFDMIFGAVMGGFTGGFGGGMGSGLFGTSSITGSSGGFFPGFAGGGDTGYGPRTGGLDGQGGFLAMLHPRETVIDHTRPRPANQNQSNDNGRSGDLVINNVINVPAGTSPETAPALAREITKEVKRQLPDAITKFNANPLRRAS
ncbi:phage tail length tape measure family protein [Devosia ginsengisoli]|uniref:phage tail length tape measure family protein n=1 Tax=Devosia ginsengisoli TaxID=400770 RepID=UPI001AED737D|nr:phage tail length tape measure family protein [Devosia ginsengisoli]